MDEDDEFGDLYTDVLTAFPSSSSSSVPAPPIGLNLVQSDHVHVDTEVNLNPDAPSNLQSQPPSLLPTDNSELEEELPAAPNIHTSDSSPRVLHTIDNPDDNNVGVNQPNFDIQEEEEEEKQREEQEDGEDKFKIDDEPPIIPGLDTGSLASKPGGDREEEGDDWDSDSDDDLQIVLNDTNHGSLGMEPTGMLIGSDDEDEDGEPLVIVADDDHHHQPSEDQDWGDDAVQPSDGKDPTLDASKPNGTLLSAPKPGYANFGYHPFHSQFKYVRPGAAPLPGGHPVGAAGAPGQVRPPVNLGAMAGRGRGDWRPPGMKGAPMQKGFHSSFWGGNGPGRGLEFTLPSHKTIFDVDIDSFEEKPWRHPGVDVSDFFNFGLIEDSWKEYCKQLEQVRLESTMQSKIRVYESSRAEQEYDPDLPPELAAAAGIHDSSAGNANAAKADGAPGDLAKGSARVRPPLPTGRAIQVETGGGERLPSVDTRPPRLRDSDAVIEIVLQGSMDDESTSKGAAEHPDDDSAKEDDKIDVVGEDGPQDGFEYSDGYPQGYCGTKEDVTGDRSPAMSAHDQTQEDERGRSPPQRTSSDFHSGSIGHSPTENVASPCEERWTEEKTSDKSPHMSSGESALERRSHDYQLEDSIGSMEGKHSPVSSSANPAENTRGPSLEGETPPENDIPPDIKSEKVKENSVAVSSNISKDKHRVNSSKHQVLSSRAEQPAIKEIDAGDDFKTSRSSDNSKPTGSSIDHLKWRESGDDEVVQNGRSSYKRHRDDGAHDSRRKDRDGRMDLERTYLSAKGKESGYSHGDWDPCGASHVYQKSEGFDRRKERDYSEVGWKRRDEDTHGRRLRSEDPRKQDRGDEMVSRHRLKARDIDMSDKDEYLHSRKPLDNGSWRGYHDKDVGLRCREKDDTLKGRHEILDDHHSKRRKDEHVRRDYVERDVSLSHRESSSIRRKQEKDDISNLRKRDDPRRARDNMDDHHSVRLNDEVWLQRERAVSQRERDEWYRLKFPYEENLPRREREDGRASIRSGRIVEEKIWVGHPRGKEDYRGHDKDRGTHGDLYNRRDRLEDEISLQHRGSDDAYARGTQLSIDGKRSRQERSSSRKERPAHALDNQTFHEKKHKDHARKARESEGMSGPSKRRQGEKGLEMGVITGINEHAEAVRDTLADNLAGESKGVSSDDEQHDSKRGRSKLERWTSHKEWDYAMKSKLSSLKVREINKEKTGGSQSSTRAQDEYAQKAEYVDKNTCVPGTKHEGGFEGKDADARPIVDGGHLDTVEKLKRRSERFKLPLTSDKELTTITRKTESVASLPPTPQSEVPTNSEVKQERPARKRRWISSS